MCNTHNNNNIVLNIVNILYGKYIYINIYIYICLCNKIYDEVRLKHFY